MKAWMFKCTPHILMAVAMMAGAAFPATETLFGNSAFAVAPGAEVGNLWVFSRGDVNSGVTLLKLKVNGERVQVAKSEQVSVGDSMTAVQDGVFSDVLAEHRRIPAVRGGKLGTLLPMFGMDDDGNFLKPEGFFSLRDVNHVYESPLMQPIAAEDVDSAMTYAVSGFAYDSAASVLWIARGALGLESYDVSKGVGDPRETLSLMDVKQKALVPLKQNADVKLGKFTSVFDVALNPEDGKLWLATGKGLWIRDVDGSVKKASKALDSMRVTGVWIGGKPLQVIVETSSQGKESVKGGLWRKFMDKNKDFAKVDFLDTAGKVQKKDVYDNGDYTVGDVVFLEKTAFVLVRAVASTVSGFFRLDTAGVRAYDRDAVGTNLWLYGFETGVTDRDAVITSMTSFPLAKNLTGLAVATYGNGISVSADSGKTWIPILNRAKLGNNLESIRMVPSVISAGEESLVSYKLGKNSKITIDVFSYDMKKVRTIVKSAGRFADASRSTNAKEDVWNGLDDYGRPCTMGIYYVRVKDNHGHVGWGKVMTTGGNR